MKDRNILYLGVLLGLIGIFLFFSFNGSLEVEKDLRKGEMVARDYLKDLEPYKVLNGEDISLVDSKNLSEGEQLFKYQFSVDSQENVDVRETAWVEMVVRDESVVRVNYSENLIISKNYCSEDQRNTDICTMEYNPVCGSNGKTYSNPCFACQSSSVDYYIFGEC